MSTIIQADADYTTMAGIASATGATVLGVPLLRDGEVASA